tara:strand:- start:63 stop:911 length:849 start_codon:yes stop_codon:yes gene_type:complete
VTYSNWREELSESKVRLARALFKGLPAMVKKIPVRSTVSRDVGVKKGVRGFIQSLKDYDGTTSVVRKSTMQYNKPKKLITNIPINPATNKPFKLLKSQRTGKFGRIQFKNFKGEYTDLPPQPYNPLDPNTFRPITTKSGSLRKASKSGLKKDYKTIDDADNINLLQTGEADILKKMRKAQYDKQFNLNTKAAIEKLKREYPFLKSGSKKDLKKKPKNDTYIDPSDGKEYDIPEEVMAAPTNSVGSGQIAGTVEAGDDPPKKKKKKKTYAYGGRGSRKMWMSK